MNKPQVEGTGQGTRKLSVNNWEKKLGLLIWKKITLYCCKCKSNVKLVTRY